MRYFTCALIAAVQHFPHLQPNKNLEEKDGDLKFICHWVEELRGYSFTEILNRAYLNESPYPELILE